MISPFIMLARMLRRRSITPPRRVGRRRRLTRHLVEVLAGERREVALHQHFVVAHPGHLERLALVAARLLPGVERHRGLLLRARAPRGRGLALRRRELRGTREALEPLPLVGVE